MSGFEFRKVKLPPDSHRGGVLTMASVRNAKAMNYGFRSLIQEVVASATFQHK